jgi:hypothetical protein
MKAQTIRTCDAFYTLLELKNREFSVASRQGKRFAATLKRDFQGGSIQLVYTSPKERGSWSLRAEIDLTKVMEHSSYEEIFSDLLLADESGAVFYQKRSGVNPSGLEFTSLDSLMDKPDVTKEKKAGDETDGNGEGEKKKPPLVRMLPLFKEIEIGGIKYVVFAQSGVLGAGGQVDKGRPGVPTTLHAESDKKDGVFILAGIIPAQKFNAEARAISTDPLLLLIAAILAAFFTFPYIKLRWMGPEDRLTPGDIIFLIFFSIMGTGLMTFAVTDFVAYGNLQQLLDDRLRSEVMNITRSFRSDLDEAYEQLKTFDQSCMKDPGCKGMAKPKPAEQKGPTNATKKRKETNKNNEKKELRNNKFQIQIADENKWNLIPFGGWRSELKYFDVNGMIWVGPDGWTTMRWSREAGQEQRIDLSERSYVKRIWDGTGIPEKDSSRERFWIEPIYSWTTGENYVILSKESVAEVPDVGPPGRPIVAAIEVKLPSVMDPVVLPGFGFAVIDQQGEVLFHSDSRRNLRENLFEETDQNSRLRSIVLARATTDVFDGKYWGKDRRFYVSPLPDIDDPHAAWSLVAYRDKDLWRMANLQTLVFAGSLFIMYAVLVVGIPILGLLVYPDLKRGQFKWLWPQPAYAPHYCIITLLNLCILLVFGIAMYWRDWAFSLLLYLLILAILGTSLLIVHRILPWWSDRFFAHLDYGQKYVGMMTTCLLVYGMAPAFGLFCLAFDAEMRLQMKLVQFDYRQDLERRSQRISHFYHGIVGHVSENGSHDIKGARQTHTRQLNIQQQAENAAVSMDARSGPPDPMEKFLAERLARCSEPNDTCKGTRGVYKEFLFLTNEVGQQPGDVQCARAAGVFPRAAAMNAQSAALSCRKRVHDAAQQKTDKVWKGNERALFERIQGLVRVWHRDEASIDAGAFINADFNDSSYCWDSPEAPRTIQLLAPARPGMPDSVISSIPANVPAWLYVALSLATWRLLIPSVPGTVVVGNWPRRRALHLKFLLPMVAALALMGIALGLPPSTVLFFTALILFCWGLGVMMSFAVDRVFLLEFPVPWKAKQSAKENPEREMTNEEEGRTIEQEVFLRESGPLREHPVPAKDEKAQASLGKKLGDIEQHLQTTSKPIAHVSSDEGVENGGESGQGRKLRAREEVIQEVFDAAREYYKDIWGQLDRSQATALFHLAKDRFVYARNPALRFLLKKGYVIMAPHLQVMNESFRRFVVTAGERERLIDRERRGAGSPWVRSWRPVGIGLTCVAIFLMWTQEDYRAITLAFVTALPALLETLPQLGSNIMRGKPDSASV